MSAGGLATPVVTRTVVAAPAAVAPVAPARPGVRQLELTVGPLPNPDDADNLVDLFKEITDLGTIEPLDAGRATEGLRRFSVLTSSTDSDLIDLFNEMIPEFDHKETGRFLDQRM